MAPRADAAVPLNATESSIPQPSQSAQVVHGQPQNSRGGVATVVVIALLIILILVVPIFPRDRVVYVNGVTQAVTMSTSYNTSIQTYTTSAPMQIGVYQGTLQYIPDQYYSQYYNQNYYNQYYYGNYYNQYQYPYYYGNYYANTSSPSCYYGSYDDYYCSYSYYYYYPYYGYYNNYPYRYTYYNNYSPYYSNYNYNYATTVTVNPSDNVVRVQQTQESNGLMTLTLTHFDGTSNTYRHVIRQSLAQSATSTIPLTNIVTNTITNSAVTPVTSAVQCQNCILQHVTDHVSLIQLLLGY